MKHEIHTMIVWSDALEEESIIENIIKSKFRILREFKVYWDSEFFRKNLRCFYSHSQKHLGKKQFEKLIDSKMIHCRTNAFYLYLLEDLNPSYEIRMTSYGKKLVNGNVFDVKLNIRNTTGERNKIHVSNDIFESNKDVTILLGWNIHDTLKKTEEGKVYEIYRDCLGINGFHSIEELFYLLNNSIKYVVLRNYECLPKKYTLKGHGDIDLLVEDLNYVIILTHAIPVFPEDKNRVHYVIKIKNEWIPFDFRFVGDNYYDINWQHGILNEYKYFNSIRIPNDINHFYALLYHAYVQKVKIKSDYFPKLEELGQNIGINYHREMNIQQIKTIIDLFLSQNGYKYTIPDDPSVFYNYMYSQDLYNLKNYGIKLSSSIARVNGDIYYSEVFLNEKSKRVYKLCSAYIGKNEERCLKKLKNTKIVPELFNSTIYGKNYVLEIEKLDGYVLSELNLEGSFWKLSNINIILKKSIDILMLLSLHKIQHRDIRPSNLIWNNETSELNIIDFGWAIDNDLDEPITPAELNEQMRKANNDFCDIYAMGKTLRILYSGFPSLQKYIREVFILLEKDPTINNLRSVQKSIFFDYKFSLIEKVKWILKKNPRIDYRLHQIYYRFIS